MPPGSCGRWVEPAKRRRGAGELYCQGKAMSIVWSQHEVQDPERFDVVTSATVDGVRVIVKITSEAIEDKGRPRCFAKAEAIIRKALATNGELPKAIVISNRELAAAD